MGSGATFCILLTASKLLERVARRLYHCFGILGLYRGIGTKISDLVCYKMSDSCNLP